jgi:hypothetical protein
MSLKKECIFSLLESCSEEEKNDIFDAFLENLSLEKLKHVMANVKKVKDHIKSRMILDLFYSMGFKEELVIQSVFIYSSYCSLTLRSKKLPNLVGRYFFDWNNFDAFDVNDHGSNYEELNLFCHSKVNEICPVLHNIHDKLDDNDCFTFDLSAPQNDELIEDVENNEVMEVVDQ